MASAGSSSQEQEEELCMAMWLRIIRLRDDVVHLYSDFVTGMQVQMKVFEDR